jgi:hypothetical protein
LLSVSIPQPQVPELVPPAPQASAPLASVLVSLVQRLLQVLLALAWQPELPV